MQVQAELALRASSLWLIVLLGVTLVALSLVSMLKERHCPSLEDTFRRPDREKKSPTVSRQCLVVEQILMTHKPRKAAVAKHLVELRREAVATLKRFHMIAERLTFYEQYLALSKTYDVKLAGPFLVINRR